MDLYIRSQDRKRLVPNPNLYVVYDEKNEIAYIGDMSVGHIGKYKTEERALEVLDEIQDYLINLDKAVIYSMIPADDYLNVYEMPKE